MSDQRGRFHPSELDIALDADSAELLATARDLEAYANTGTVAPSADFEDRVMAAIALEPMPRPSTPAVGSSASCAMRGPRRSGPVDRWRSVPRASRCCCFSPWPSGRSGRSWRSGPGACSPGPLPRRRRSSRARPRSRRPARPRPRHRRRPYRRVRPRPRPRARPPGPPRPRPTRPRHGRSRGHRRQQRARRRRRLGERRLRRKLGQRLRAIGERLGRRAKQRPLDLSSLTT